MTEWIWKASTHTLWFFSFSHRTEILKTEHFKNWSSETASLPNTPKVIEFRTRTTRWGGKDKFKCSCIYNENLYQLLLPHRANDTSCYPRSTMRKDRSVLAPGFRKSVHQGRKAWWKGLIMARPWERSCSQGGHMCWWLGKKKAEHTQARTWNVHHLQRPDLFLKALQPSEQQICKKHFRLKPR